MPAAKQASRLPVSPPVLWTGIAAGVFLAVEAMVHGVVLPLALGVIADAALTFLLIVAMAVALAELTRRHHHMVLHHGGRLSASGARHVQRHGSGVLAWLATKARSWRVSREHRPLMFRKVREDEAAGTRRLDGKPETDADKRFFDLRESGYTGPINQDGYAVPDAPPPEHADTNGGTTSMTVSKIAPEHRAQRAAARSGGTVPSEWGPVIAQTADFEPEDDGELLEWMTRQVTGLSGWAEALVDFYEHCTQVIGIDPKASAMLHDVADAAAQAAETMGAAKARFTEHYELPREFAANGGLMTHDGRWVTGEGA